MHPLEIFRYCPVCGSQHFEEYSNSSKKCDNCGFEYYMNAAAATAAFILNDRGELLVERRKLDPGKGTYDLPGGFCDISETAEESVVREVKEETNLDITDAQFLFSLPNIYLYSGFKVRTLDFFFRCTVSDTSTLRASDDAAECLWMPLRDIHTEQFGLRSIRQALFMFLEQQNL